MKILFGCELNIVDYDGGIDLDEVFASPLDYGIASLHDVCITPGSRTENTRAYLKAMENPKVHIIGHRTTVHLRSILTSWFAMPRSTA